DIAFRDIRSEEYLGILFSGGRAPEYLREDEEAIQPRRVAEREVPLLPRDVTRFEARPVISRRCGADRPGQQHEGGNWKREAGDDDYGPPHSSVPTQSTRPQPGRYRSNLTLLEIRSGRIVVQQVVRRNPVLGRVAGHQFPGDAVRPGILIQTNLAVDVIHLVAPGPSDAGNVETLDRLLLAVVAHLAEHTQLTPTAVGLGAELLIEFLTQ